MFEFENHVTINLAVEEVFRFATDLRHVPDWNYYVHSVQPTSKRMGVIGASYHQVRKEDEQDLRIVQIEKNKSFIVETIPPSTPAFRREMTFKGDERSTNITDRWELTLGVPKLLEGLAANRAKQGVRENLGKLKELLETGKVTLQDGRTISLR